MTTEYSDEYVQRAIDDRDYWLSIAPPGYRLIGFTYRSSATFAYDSKHYEGIEHTVNIEQAHIDFFRPPTDEEE